MTTSDGLRGLRVAALGAAVILTGIACTPTRPPRGRTTTTTTTTGGHNHNPDRLNHEPTEAQKAEAIDLIRRTRAAVRAQGVTLRKLQDQGFINNGDGIHWIKPDYARDGLELNPDYVESFVVRGGQVQAAMYSLNLGKTMDDVPDLAGNWTQWHAHNLAYQSNNPNTDEYFKLGGFPPGTRGYFRDTAPMIHVWLVPNACGPFAGTEREEGSCIPNIDPDFP
jgi:hypothetical protein